MENYEVLQTKNNGREIPNLRPYKTGIECFTKKKIKKERKEEY